jgi:glycosyltransferase involved in cell wall biosynthesis
MNKKLFLIFHGRFPSEKAASLFAAKSAEVFGKSQETILLVPKRKGAVTEDPFRYYNVKHTFKVVYIPTIDIFNIPIIGRLGFIVSFFSFSVLALLYLVRSAQWEDIIYSNENLPLLFASFVFKNTFYEMHDFPNKRFYFYYKILLQRVRWVLIHNKWKANKAVEVLGIPRNKIICEINAVELNDFGSNIGMEEARTRLGLNKDIKIVVYTGHLYGWKGANILAEASSMLEEGVVVYFVGGTPEDVSSFKIKYESPSAQFMGHQSHADIPYWQAAADVLVIPNTAKEDISKYYTSPMKLFEYMASGRPIVASRIPAIEEIVTEDDVYFFEPDNSKDLALKVMQAISGENESYNKVARAKNKIQEHSWSKRADRIINFMRSN